MPEELRIVVTDAGGGGGGGRGGGGLVPGSGAGGGRFVAPSVVQQTFTQSITQGIGLGVGTSLTGLAIQAAKYSVGLPYYGSKLFARTLNAESSDLAGLSAPLAQSVADSNLRSFDVRRRRAAAIGGALAGFERTRSELSSSVGDLWTEILKVMLSFFDVVKPLIENIAANVESMADFINRELPNFLDGFADNLPELFNFIKEPLHIMSRSLRAMERAAEEANMDGFFEQLMANLIAPVGFWPGDQQAPGERNRAFARRARRNGF